MTFTEWYNSSNYGDWDEECRNQHGFALKATIEYEEWCKECGVNPDFDS